MADYWIKLYHEILDDPKMGTLPDRLWRRCIEMFLLAGRLGGISKEGILPDTPDIAWALRINADDLDLDLKQLASAGILERIVGGWKVIHFQKRQAPSTDAERQRYHRDKESHELVTFRDKESHELVQESESESEEKEQIEQRDRIGVIVPKYGELPY